MDTDVLNEPEVLQTLKLRLYNNRIYTFVENSLLAVNPYYYIHSLYSNLLKSFYGDKIIQKQENIRDVHSNVFSTSLICTPSQLSPSRNSASRVGIRLW